MDSRAVGYLVLAVIIFAVVWAPACAEWTLHKFRQWRIRREIDAAWTSSTHRQPERRVLPTYRVGDGVPRRHGVSQMHRVPQTHRRMSVDHDDAA